MAPDRSRAKADDIRREKPHKALARDVTLGRSRDNWEGTQSGKKIVIVPSSLFAVMSSLRRLLLR
jgi:hypothetical protein